VLRLITIPISHYCEKARWALDRPGIEYREERHIQLIHSFYARRARGGRTVPVLVTPERTLAESQDIVRWADERAPEDLRLFPTDPVAREEVETLCARFDGELGPKARRLIYVYMFREDPIEGLRINDQGVPAWEDWTIRHSWPLAQRAVGRVLGIRPGIEVQDEEAVFAELDFVAERLGDGRAHLCGDEFTAADLTFAALAAAVALPREYGVELPQPENLTPQTARLIERVREHPAGRYALRMFAEQRRPHATAAPAPEVAPASAPAQVTQER
jgi:glutathione S-transferase